MTQEEDEEDDEHPDIRHTAPQHRQYLGRFNEALGALYLFFP